ncbi:SCO4225 family membrane protein [Microbispora sp. NPDC049125]|uniref:SCO4225 family membrane protein n=1 Tax=Microbispora sp. NPDC049125 TaxID=3154929 RepID=UPI00346765FF
MRRVGRRPLRADRHRHDRLRRHLDTQARQPRLETVVLFAVTSPASELLLFLPLASLPDDPPGPQIFLLTFTAAGLFQAWLLWLIARGRRRSNASGGGAPAPG